jgi:hypothetical protein
MKIRDIGLFLEDFLLPDAINNFPCFIVVKRGRGVQKKYVKWFFNVIQAKIAEYVD